MKSSRIILELRDLDQSGPSQRKNDSDLLSLPYLSLPCLGYKSLKLYRRVNDTISKLMIGSNLENKSGPIGHHNEDNISVDAFLEKVFGREV